MYIAIEPDLDGNAVVAHEIRGTCQPLCEECFEKHSEKGMEVAHGKVPIYMQSPWGLIEVSE